MKERSPQQFQRIPRPSSRPYPQQPEEEKSELPLRPGLRPDNPKGEDLSQTATEPALRPIPARNPTGLARAAAPHLYEPPAPDENLPPIPKRNPTGLARAAAPHLYSNPNSPPVEEKPTQLEPGTKQERDEATGTAINRECCSHNLGRSEVCCWIE